MSTTTDTTRDPGFVVDRARTGWARWHPGDGTAYSVRIVPIDAGADHGDVVLLVNEPRRTAAFQLPTAKYRLAETGPWNKTRAKQEGIGWAWNAAEPLLRQIGVTRGGVQS